MSNHIASDWPRHPAGILREKSAGSGLPTAALARKLGLSRQTLYEILAERQCITPSVSLRVAKLTATSPKLWLDLQQAFDLARVARREPSAIASVPVLEERW